MAAKKKSRRKPAKRRKTTKARGGQIPLRVLEKRLASLARTVKARRAKRQITMFE